jgi:hypothetical protein
MRTLTLAILLLACASDPDSPTHGGAPQNESDADGGDSDGGDSTVTDTDPADTDPGDPPTGDPDPGDPGSGSCTNGQTRCTGEVLEWCNSGVWTELVDCASTGQDCGIGPQGYYSCKVP